jgi:hypothetical protein
VPPQLYVCVVVVCQRPANYGCGCLFSVVEQVTIDESTVQSGDFFGIIRLDGLDPMLAWAMGSTTGHTTVAIRDASGELYIAESTVNDVYWYVVCSVGLRWVVLDAVRVGCCCPGQQTAFSARPSSCGCSRPSMPASRLSMRR